VFTAVHKTSEPWGSLSVSVHCRLPASSAKCYPKNCSSDTIATSNTPERHPPAQPQAQPQAQPWKGRAPGRRRQWPIHPNPGRRGQNYQDLAISPQGRGLAGDHDPWHLPGAADPPGPNDAIALGRELAPFELSWIADPIPPNDYDGLRQISQTQDPPICTGETFHQAFEFLRPTPGVSCKPGTSVPERVYSAGEWPRHSRARRIGLAACCSWTRPCGG
jgi:hypothetical protein